MTPPITRKRPESVCRNSARVPSVPPLVDADECSVFGRHDERAV
jgi:hypothetical protein